MAPRIACCHEVADSGLGEVRVFESLVVEFRRSPAVGDVLGVLARVLLGCEQVTHAVAVRLNEQDAGRGCERVGPLDVEAYLEIPVRVRNRQVAPTGLVDLFEVEARRRSRPVGALQGQAVLRAERVQIAHRIRIVVGVHDPDGLARAGSGGRRVSIDVLDRAG